MKPNFFRSASATLLVAFTAAGPAWAGNAVAVPGPMIGAGLPALALFGAGYWLIRRRRRT
jgi:uncharacterized membrane protein